MSETAKLFEDRENAGDWRVEWIDNDGGIEVAIFAGPNARAGDRIRRLPVWDFRGNQSPAAALTLGNFTPEEDGTVARSASSENRSRGIRRFGIASDGASPMRTAPIAT